jgi:hypothetical protein
MDYRFNRDMLFGGMNLDAFSDMDFELMILREEDPEAYEILMAEQDESMIAYERKMQARREAKKFQRAQKKEEIKEKGGIFKYLISKLNKDKDDEMQM